MPCELWWLIAVGLVAHPRVDKAVVLCIAIDMVYGHASLWCWSYEGLHHSCVICKTHASDTNFVIHSIGSLWLQNPFGTSIAYMPLV